jgi:hypothetical protein
MVGEVLRDSWQNGINVPKCVYNPMKNWLDADQPGSTVWWGYETRRKYIGIVRATPKQELRGTWTDS